MEAPTYHSASDNTGTGDGTGTGTVASGTTTGSNITSSMPAPPTLKRRRSKSPSPTQGRRLSEDQDRERKRGRPRVDRGNDPSAADRRRTQIREAQRAYRARKETTLETLRTRVTELSSAITRLNTAFVTYRHSVNSSGGRLPHPHRRALNDTVTEFERTLQSIGSLTSVEGDVDSALPSTTSAQASMAESVPETVQSVADANKYASPGMKRTKMQPVDPGETIDHFTSRDDLTSWLDPPTPAEVKRGRHNMASTAGYTTYLDDHLSPARTVPPDMYVFGKDSTSTAPLNSTRARRSNNTNGHNIVLPSPSQLEQLPLPLSFSGNEPTFGRWLHRSSLEQGEVVLSNPSKFPLTYERVFRCSKIGSAEHFKMCRALKDLCEYGINQAMNIWQTPLVHVGGNGTHYTRDPNNCNSFVPSRKKPAYAGTFEVSERHPLWNAYNIPFTTEVSIDIDLEGFQGEWFDPYDVQGYMEEKGIFIRPDTGYVNVEILHLPQPAVLSASGEQFTSSSGAATSESGRVGSPAENDDYALDAEQAEMLKLVGAQLDRYSTGMVVGGIGYYACMQQQHQQHMQRQHQHQQQDDQQVQSPSSSSSSNAWRPIPQYSTVGALINGHTTAHPSNTPSNLDERAYQSTQIDLMFATTPENGVPNSAPPTANTLPTATNGVHGSSNSSHIPSTAGVYALASMLPPGSTSLLIPQMKNAVVDVDKFVRVLTVFGICLGSGAPGFRRRDVDRALAMSSWDV